MHLRPHSFIALLLAAAACQDVDDAPTGATRQQEGAFAAASDLLLSEYVEGSGNNKAIEVFNGTGASINLANYQLRMFFNGATTPATTVQLAGTIAPGDVHVVVQAQASAELLALADQTSSASWFNGDDAIILVNAGNTIDSFGQVGFDPGTAWGTGSATTTIDNTLRRADAIDAGDPEAADAFEPSAQWVGSSSNDFGGLGFHGSGGDSGSDEGDDSSSDGSEPPVAVRIHEVQSGMAASPYVGRDVVIEGIVVAAFQASAQLGGFFRPGAGCRRGWRCDQL